jgi:hypothetical protein
MERFLSALAGSYSRTPTLIYPDGFDPLGVNLTAVRVQEGPLYLVHNPLQVLTTYENRRIVPS